MLPGGAVPRSCTLSPCSTSKVLHPGTGAGGHGAQRFAGREKGKPGDQSERPSQVHCHLGKETLRERMHRQGKGQNTNPVRAQRPKPRRGAGEPILKGAFPEKSRRAGGEAVLFAAIGPEWANAASRAAQSEPPSSL